LATDLALLARLRARFGQRAPALLLTLLVETLMVLAVLSLGLVPDQPKTKPGTRLVSIAIKPADDDKPQQSKQAPAKPSPAPLAAQPRSSAPRPAETVAVQPAAPAVPPPAFIAIPKNQLATLDISRVPRQAAAPGAAKALYGPVDTGSPGDSRRIGSAPNGQPLYAASWYREPSDMELAGYLSTAEGPGYALIACRTAPEWRVEDCVALDEYPSGSNMARAVLAAAWQFKVRPPRLGGVYKVGEWVRIRIDYEMRPRRGG
jgi:protein TonB